MARKLTLTAALLVIGLLVAACGGGGGDDASSSADSSAGGEVQRIEVVMREFSYEPQTITVQRGVPVEIVLINEGNVHHDFHVDALSVKSDRVAAGQSSTLRFTPNQAGEFQIACLEPGHLASGMVATLIVQ